MLLLLEGKALLTTDTVHCIDSTAIYRANVTAILSHSPSLLVHILSTWLANTSSLQDNTYTLDNTCPVHITSNTEPLCIDTVPPVDGSNNDSVLGEVVGALVVLLLLTVAVGVALGVLLWRLYRKRVKSWT